MARRRFSITRLLVETRASGLQCGECSNFNTERLCMRLRDGSITAECTAEDGPRTTNSFNHCQIEGPNKRFGPHRAGIERD